MPQSSQWTWDPAKNRENQRKHGIRFENALRVFDDTNVFIEEDPFPYEQRYHAIGKVRPGTARNAFLTVVYTPPPDDTEGHAQPGRIISARISTAHERREYEEEQL